MTFDRTEYQRAYMAKRRADQPTSHKARMRLALEAIADRLAESETDEGRELRQIALDALDDPPITRPHS